MNRIVIPQLGGIAHQRDKELNNVLSFVFNKMYIETSDLSFIVKLKLKENIDECITFVGKVSKINVGGSKYIYRQRIMVASLKLLLSILDSNDVKFVIPSTFKIPIGCVLNCISELDYLEKCAIGVRSNIDTWMTDCAVIQLTDFLLSSNFMVSCTYRYNHEYEAGYLNRSLFLYVDSETHWLSSELQEHKNKYTDTLCGFSTKALALDCRR